MRRGFGYLFAVLDWACRRVLSWRLSNTLTTNFCKAAVQEAINHYGKPEIINTNQGCWRDNVFVERLWRSVKYEKAKEGRTGCPSAQTVYTPGTRKMGANPACRAGSRNENAQPRGVGR